MPALLREGQHAEPWPSNAPGRDGQPLTAIGLYAEHSQLLLEIPSERAIPQLIENQDLILRMVRRTREITDHLRCSAGARTARWKRSASPR